MSSDYTNSFWENDFLSQNGYETLSTHMKEGQKSCKWLEDYLKQRAKAEEEYSKALLKISRAAIGEFGSLRKTLEKLCTETDAEHKMHAEVATKLYEQSAKLSEFRERQKEERKRQEDNVHRAHKNKADTYRRMMSCKSTYENRFRAAEKAESDAEKLKFGSKPKETEKAKTRAFQSRTLALKCDDEYKTSVITLESARVTWQQNHSIFCAEFQRMEQERIIAMRNMVWVLSNLDSDLCCQIDDSRESIRMVAEKCSEEMDIREFATQKFICETPLQEIHYQQCGTNGIAPQINSSPTNRVENLNQGLPPIPNGQNAPNHIYEVGEDPNIMFTALYDYIPRSSDQMELKEGDRLKQLSPADGGWIKCLNIGTKQIGTVPANYIEN